MKFFIVLIGLINACYGSLSRPECAHFKHDPYETNSVVPRGKFKGQCLDLRYKRNLKLIDSNKKYIKVANFLHDSRYWIAHIPTGDIFNQAILQLEYFSPEILAAHTQLRFDLKDSYKIDLYGQNESNKGLHATVKSFVISFEVVKVIDGPRFNLFKATQDYYGITGRIFSLQTAYDDIVERRQSRNDQLILNLSSKQLTHLFHFYLVHAQKNVDHHQMYNTLNKNCVTELFAGFEYLNPKWTPTTLLRYAPAKAISFIRDKGLLKAQEFSLEQERDLNLRLESTICTPDS